MSGTYDGKIKVRHFHPVEGKPILIGPVLVMAEYWNNVGKEAYERQEKEDNRGERRKFIKKS